MTLRLRASFVGGGFVRAGATGEEAAFGCPKLALSVVGELEDSDENGLLCADIVVESKNDDDKFGMPQPQHCHETFLNARRSYMSVLISPYHNVVIHVIYY